MRADIAPRLRALETPYGSDLRLKLADMQAAPGG
jgi:hypothetical protein